MPITYDQAYEATNPNQTDAQREQAALALIAGTVGVNWKTSKLRRPVMVRLCHRRILPLPLKLALLPQT